MSLVVTVIRRWHIAEVIRDGDPPPATWMDFQLAVQALGRSSVMGTISPCRGSGFEPAEEIAGARLLSGFHEGLRCIPGLRRMGTDLPWPSFRVQQTNAATLPPARWVCVR